MTMKRKKYQKPFIKEKKIKILFIAPRYKFDGLLAIGSCLMFSRCVLGSGCGML